MIENLRDELCHFCGEYSCKEGNFREEVPADFCELAKQVRVCRACAGKLRIVTRLDDAAQNVKKRNS